MDSKSFGKNISFIRKSRGIKQSELAEMINVSNKTISKWETGRGFPEFTMIPLLTKALGINASDLFETEKSGITVAGNICMDNLRMINWFPELNKGTEVIDADDRKFRFAGGCIATTLGNLRAIDKNINLSAICRLGVDEDGRYLLSLLQQQRIDVRNIKMIPELPTASTDVYMDMGTKTMSYFYSLGANNRFEADDIDIKNVNSKILLVGHIMQLNGLYEEDSDYGYKIGRILCQARQNGIQTAICATAIDDVKLCKKMMDVCAPHCDYFITGHDDACYISGERKYNQKRKITQKNVDNSINYFFKKGVKKAVVVYSENGGIFAQSNGKSVKMGMPDVDDINDENYLGIGGAFLAGLLYGVHEEKTPEEIMKIATAAMCFCARKRDAISGMVDRDVLLKFALSDARKEFRV